jgi:hypothetical protein
MKKIVIGISALFILIAGTAFTVSKNAGKAQTGYYFYKVENGIADLSAPLNSSPMTEADFKSANLVDCPEGDNEDCVRGWESGHTPTQQGPADDVIRKQ